MRVAFLCAVLLATPAAIAQDPFLTGDALLEHVRENCAEGCLVLRREEAAALTRNVQGVVAEREKAAYQSGKHACWKSV